MSPIPHVPASTLPDSLTPAQLAALLGISYRTLRDWRGRRDWPFSPIQGLPATGRMARYAKAQVLAVMNGQVLPKKAMSA